MPTYQNEEAEIFYEIEGSGYPILLIAPGGMRSENALWNNMPWNPRKELAREYQLIGMDQRNAGSSYASISATDGWENYTRDQLGLLDELGVNQCHVIGMCIGGPFIAALLKADPERFTSAVILQPVGIDNNRPAFYDMFDSWAADLIAERKELQKETMDEFRSNMWDGNFMLTASESEVSELTNPILLCMGDDLYHPQSTSRKVASLAPNVTFIEQWKTLETLEKTNSVIHSFLAQHA